MQITRVEAFQPIAPNSPPDWRTSLGQFAVRIETGEGLVGYGVGGGGAAGVHVVHSVLAPLLTGRDSEPVEALWEEMYEATLPFGRKGIAVMALSGVDLALWDLRGKRAGQSVARWLHPRSAEEVSTYATVWDVGPDERGARLQPPIPESFRGSAVKLHVRVFEEDDPVGDIVRRVEAARRILGPDSRLMIDAWMKWDVDLTLRIAERIERWNVDWIEEPLAPDDWRGYERLARDCPVSIAGGEHEFTAAAFRDIIQMRLHSVLQPDVCWVGGMTELVKIYHLAREAGVRVVPHRGSEVWGLHAIAALDPEPLAEEGRPWMTWVEGQPSINSGRIAVPDRPGFGVSIDAASIFNR